jgi:hypothetical protein
MKKQRITAIILVIFFLTLLIVMRPTITEFAVYSKNFDEKITLGYCPTMQEDAIYFKKSNNYNIIEFGSASEVLTALKNNQIDKGLIGRKAESYEINPNINETVLKSGITLVSNEKGFIDYRQLSNYEIYTYVAESSVEDLNLKNSKIIYLSKEEAIEKIKEGKFVLIYWEDWTDDFELIVVMNGTKKSKEFRGVFLYENAIR